MFLSIVIPVWNDEKYLNACLDSCLAQDLSKDEYEILCVDDGSTDKTPEILREYEERYPNVHPYFMQHQGGSFGRVTGMELAKGKYVWFVDHDDLVAPHALDRLHSFVQSNPGFARYRFPYYEFYDALTAEEQRRFEDGTLKSNSSDLQDNVVWSSIFKIDALHKNEISPRSPVIEKTKLFWDLEKLRLSGSDCIFVQECIDKGLSTKDLGGIPLYYYRRSSASETMLDTPEAINRRAVGAYGNFLVSAYLAYQLKTEYLREKQALGQAEAETVVRAITRTRVAVGQLAELPGEYWKSGFQCLTEKKILFTAVPDDYPYRFRDYIKARPLRSRVKPSVIAFYFMFTMRGAKWYRFLNGMRNSGRQFSFLRRIRNRQKGALLRKKGTSG